MKGSVTLVGAGCGRDLITLKGLAAVKNADVLIYDDLQDADLLNKAQKGCQFIYAGKHRGGHQEALYQLLIEKAQAKKDVVHLKHGDSFVFEGSEEEILALQAAGISYDVIPGVSACIAIPENAGIPVTHRTIAPSFTVATGPLTGGKKENYAALAALNGTLVFPLGMNHIEEITDELLWYGKPASTPATVISKGLQLGERLVRGSLSDIAQKAAGLEDPAILVIGSVAELEWERTLPLSLERKSVTVTGTRSFTDKMTQKLQALGAYVQQIPTICIHPDYLNIPDDLQDFSWAVFTSVNGVDIFFRYLKETQMDIRQIAHMKFACMGSGTEQRLQHYGIFADFVPSDSKAEIMGRELAAIVVREKNIQKKQAVAAHAEAMRREKNRKELSRKSSDQNLAGVAHERSQVLLLRAKNGSPKLTEELRQAGISYLDCGIYSMDPEQQLDGMAKAVETDYIVFAGVSDVKACKERNLSVGNMIPVCISPAAADECRKIYEKDCIVPVEHTADGMITAIVEDCLQQELRLDIADGIRAEEKQIF